MKFSYDIEGMHCASCVEKIKTTLSTSFNLTSVTLNPPMLIVESAELPNINELNAQIAVAGKYKLRTAETQRTSYNTSSTEKTGLLAYSPIFLIAAYITLVASLSSHFMNTFMAGFFLVFSAFKMLDLRGFATGYATYDLLAKRWPVYGYIYPFMELSLGILYLTAAAPTITYVATIVIMGFSSLGVINSLLKKQQIKCACLGTLLKVPLSTITLVEDLLMVAMAAIALIL